MSIHRVILRDAENKLVSEVRFDNGTLYRQNRSYDLALCFNDFIDRLKSTKKQALKKGYKIKCDIIDQNTLWTR